MVRITLATAALLACLGVITAPAATAAGPYKNCTAAHADGRYDIPKGDPDYVAKQDRDGDGVACES
jgi:hypothetical protein